MEPFRMDQGLLRKAGIQTFQMKAAAAQDRTVLSKDGDCQFIGAGRKGAFRRYSDPQASPLSGKQSDVLCAGIKRIRIQPGCIA